MCDNRTPWPEESILACGSRRIESFLPWQLLPNLLLFMAVITAIVTLTKTLGGQQIQKFSCLSSPLLQFWSHKHVPSHIWLLTRLLDLNSDPHVFTENSPEPTTPSQNLLLNTTQVICVQPQILAYFGSRNLCLLSSQTPSDELSWFSYDSLYLGTSLKINQFWARKRPFEV